MTKELFNYVLDQLNVKLPAWSCVSTEFGGVSYNRVNVDGLDCKVKAFIYDRKAFGFSTPFTIYIDKDCCGTAKRISMIIKRDGYYHDIVEV